MPRKVLPWEPRFWSRVQPVPCGCWLWTGGTKGKGYGGCGRYHPSGYAHRASYELMVGPIPEGLQIDHLCRVRNCVNPDHLEAVTCRENLRRGVGVIGVNCAKTECIHGHPLSGPNLYVRPSGKRECIACDNRRHKECRAKRRLALNPTT